MIRKGMILCVLLACSGTVFSAGLRDRVGTSRPSVGAAVQAARIANNNEPSYTTTLANEYNMVTPENEMKWSSIHPAKNTFRFSSADTIVSFARQNRMHVRGHTLLWGRSNPSWLNNGGYSAQQLKDILVNHITTIMTYYKIKFPGIVTYWDVVNEIMNAGAGVWAPLGGSGDSLTQAFNITSIALKTARAADPTAKLCINEYSMEVNGGSTKTWQLVKRLKQAGVPLDCVGFQGHVGGSRNITKDQWIASLTAFAKLGVEVQITEFDKPGAAPDQYANALQACLAVPQCSAFVTWGFTDKYTWLGTARHPLPFDENYRKKPAWFALDSALAPVRQSIRIHAGGNAITDALGNQWQADTGYSGGSTYRTAHSIAGTTSQSLYQSERYGNFSYQLTVPNGNYNVGLDFAEIYWNSPGKRVFNVMLNGKPILSRYDIVASVGAPFKADRKYFPVTITNNKLVLQFQSVINNAKISAISIVPALSLQQAEK